MILIRRGRVYDPAGDVDHPALRDVLTEGDTILAVSAPAADGEAKQRVEAAAAQGRVEIIDARDRLVVPGFVNAHYHSYDTLAKGLIEDAPFDLWALQTQPAFYGRRSREELRLRTLLGAMEYLKAGITTVQDMCTLVPQDEGTLDVIADAYAEVGIRVVFALALRDLGDLDIAPFLAPILPEIRDEAVRRAVTGLPRDAALLWRAEEAYPPVIDGQAVGPRGHAVYTGWVNAAGLPAIALPLGLSAGGLPIGGQFVGRHGADHDLLAFGAGFETPRFATWSWPPFAEGRASP